LQLTFFSFFYLVRKRDRNRNGAGIYTLQSDIDPRVSEHAFASKVNRVWILLFALHFAGGGRRVLYFCRHEDADSARVLHVGESELTWHHGLVNPDLHHVSLILPAR